jgi:hypothetical protein
VIRRVKSQLLKMLHEDVTNDRRQGVFHNHVIILFEESIPPHKSG